MRFLLLLRLGYVSFSLRKVISFMHFMATMYWM